MQHKLINTGDYLLIVDESEIKEGDWVYCWETINGTPSNFDIILMTSKNYTHWVNGANNYKKIIAHLPLNNSPILEGVDLLPPIEDEVEKLAKQEYREFPHNSKEHPDWNYNRDIHCFKKRKAFVKGYNKAKEKYKYTKEDMINAILFGMQKGLNVGKLDETDSDWVNNYVKSLQQPKMPVVFNVETEKEICTCSCHSNPDMVHFVACCNGGYIKSSKVLTTTNSQGLTQWVGEYIY